MHRPSYVPHYLAAVVSVFAVTIFGVIELEVRQTAVDRGFLTLILSTASVVSAQLLLGLANEQSRKSNTETMVHKIEEQHKEP